METPSSNIKPSIRIVHLTDTVKIYRDPEEETVFEGHAIVWAILEESEDYYVLQVSFLSDPKAPGRKFTRKYRKRETAAG